MAMPRYMCKHLKCHAPCAPLHAFPQAELATARNTAAQHTTSLAACEAARTAALAGAAALQRSAAGQVEVLQGQLSALQGQRFARDIAADSAAVAAGERAAGEAAAGRGGDNLSADAAASVAGLGVQMVSAHAAGTTAGMPYGVPMQHASVGADVSAARRAVHAFNYQQADDLRALLNSLEASSPMHWNRHRDCQGQGQSDSQDTTDVAGSDTGTCALTSCPIATSAPGMLLVQATAPALLLTPALLPQRQQRQQQQQQAEDERLHAAATAPLAPELTAGILESVDAQDLFTLTHGSLPQVEALMAMRRHLARDGAI